MPQTKNLHLHLDEQLLTRVDLLADGEGVSRTTMIERLLRDGLEVRLHGDDLRSELRAVVRAEIVPLLIRAVRDGGIAWRLVYQLIGNVADWDLDAQELYEAARQSSDDVITTLTDEREVPA
ncbi:MAG: ribbon-helix-helix protein, CopG family [Ktedonobacterales bacterium]|nr:ribbon-helix-helix protein, CopG family [Ktedonobacterales bacterium]